MSLVTKVDKVGGCAHCLVTKVDEVNGDRIADRMLIHNVDSIFGFCFHM